MHPPSVDDEGGLVADLCRLIGAPSVTGDETAAIALLLELAEGYGLEAVVHHEDLDALRRSPDHPGEETAREVLQTLVITLPGLDPGAPRLCLSGHVDVVPPGAGAWSHPPFEARVQDGRVQGRGAADMKGGIVAALHALLAVRERGGPPGDVVLTVVGGEEDGGIGTLAALRRDSAFAGAVITEPTGGAVVCANGGALTWRMVLRGRAAHAANRLDGVSALDRYLPVHAALQSLEARVNSDVADPLMRLLALPYPLVVGTVRAGDWPSSVPDELVCEGRLGVAVGTTVEQARADFERAVAEALDPREPPAEISWSGGQFAPAALPPSHPFVARVQESIAATTGRPAPVSGLPYGSDLRHFLAHGIPTVLYGPGELAEAHATDESVEIDTLVSTARGLATLATRFGARPSER